MFKNAGHEYENAILAHNKSFRIVIGPASINNIRCQHSGSLVCGSTER